MSSTSATLHQMRRALLVFTLLAGPVLGLVVPHHVALAQTGGDGVDREARALFDAGRLAFSEGRYDNALEHFQRAYELSGRPQLLFNIGIAAERLRRDREAVAAFRAYLHALPDTDQRASVEARIGILEEAIAEDEATAQPREASSGPRAELPEPQRRAEGARITGPIVLLAGSGAVAIASVVLLGVSASQASTVEGAERGTQWEEVADAYDRAKPMSIAGAVGLGLGVALAAGGVSWLLVGSKADTPRGVAVSPALGGLIVQGRF